MTTVVMFLFESLLCGDSHYASGALIQKMDNIQSGFLDLWNQGVIFRVDFIIYLVERIVST